MGGIITGKRKEISHQIVCLGVRDNKADIRRIVTKGRD
jgi:hypothetical protein